MPESAAARPDRGPVWYAAYGSNLDPAMLRRYVPGADPGGDASRWFRTSHSLYFAGRSRRWPGSVAFLSLDQAASGTTWCRAYRMRFSDLGRIFAGENLVGDLPPTALDGLGPGKHRRVPLPASEDERLGKYDTVLRLAVPDALEGEPVVTFTTSRDLPRLGPSPAYLAVLRSALLDVLDEAGAEDYLRRAARRGSTH